MLDATLSRIDNEIDQSLNRLFDFLKIKSISTDPKFKQDCDKAADWLVEDLKSFGANAEKHNTDGHPIVTGNLGPDTGPHVLFYGHYDVQPVDPLELWDTDPFEPTLENTPIGPVIRGRGSSDDKGQLMTFVEACRAWVSENGSLPFKVSFFFEGEEESGSPSLIPFMEKHKKEISSDIVLICDTGLFDNKVPAIVTRLRGILKEEIEITGPDKDLHSGLYGGVAANPAKALVNVLSALHDKNGAVTIPNFYDDVEELPQNIKNQWRSLKFNHNYFLSEVGLSTFQEITGVDPMLIGFSKDDDQIHSPNEKYDLESFRKGIRSWARVINSFSELQNV